MMSPKNSAKIVKKLKTEGNQLKSPGNKKRIAGIDVFLYLCILKSNQPFN